MTVSLLEIACSLIKTKGWQALELTDIARAARVPLLQVYQTFPNKTAILVALNQKIDADVIDQGLLEEDDASPRDRLFEIFMRRLECLKPYREVFIILSREWNKDLLSTLAFTPQYFTSISWMLRLALIETNSLKGRLLISQVSLLFVNVLRVWLDDDSPDMALTMAELDRRLRRLSL